MVRLILSPLFLTLYTLLVACSGQSEQKKQSYYTWDGLEPDRWSSIWLLKRHLDPAAEISILPVGGQLSNASAIATPNAEIKRTHGFSNYENMLSASDKSDDIGLLRIGKLINEIEISPWKSSTPVVSVVENQFRELQLRYNRTDVPHECYAGFFDVLYAALDKSEIVDDVSLLALSEQLEPDRICQNTTDSIIKVNDVLVPEYPVNFVLKMIDAGKSVIFIDTREDDEFDEHHIPGAVNLKLRDVDSSSAKQFERADLVISYCIKDFRGYEVALALNKVGLENVGIMKPYGLKGWKDLNLPVADATVTDVEAIIRLKERAASGV